MPDPEITEDWLEGICNFDGYESAYPDGIIAPRGFTLLPEHVPSIGEFSLTKNIPNTKLIQVDEDVVKTALSLGPIEVKTANGDRVSREDFIKQYGRDPILVAAWMRRHPGVWTAKGRVTEAGGMVPTVPKEGAVKIGGKDGIRTPGQAPGAKGKEESSSVKVGK
jgi:hypothetical protein